ncbi:putative metallopeptidase [Sphingobium sp. YR657]|uniref:putative metallopeptidase n=1 Tax=Sphingobium sp. YR657 TaxID=1884366 RepID=UPI003137BBEB
MVKPTLMRPMPPVDLVEPGILEMPDRFRPAPDVTEWIENAFLYDDAPLFNPDHRHLMDAQIGVLWTNCDNNRNMRVVLGQAELMPPMAMGKWQRARAIQQIEEWFEGMPDFLITLSAPAAAGMDDASFCALVEHELYHCAQNQDLFGMPKFKNDGSPSFGIRGHDVEEFVGVVARYGAGPAGVAAMVEAAQHAPLVAPASIAGVCGTCLRLAA